MAEESGPEHGPSDLKPREQKLPSLKALAAAAKARREKAGLSQKALAELAGVGHVTVIALEKGEGGLRLEGAWRILDALGVVGEGDHSGS